MKEGYEGFRYKYRLPIDHSFDGSIEKKHHHVIEISVEFSSMKGIQRVVRMRDIEDSISNILDTYRNQFINEFPEFNGDSTIENMGEVLFKRLYEYFDTTEWDLDRFEISETPLRVYAIVADNSVA
ncbi:MAG: 6-carboxytetrahydropterin synthase [Lachnospiraceae bacterium]|nr:6-carboxytetrahydropterin synthase [Lachnospiraceae bacterium]